MAGDPSRRHTVFALFDLATEMGPVLDRLHEAGLSDIHVLSPLPLPGLGVGAAGRLPLYAITILAGLVGIGVGVFFAGGTAAMYPLMTGGKPIVAAPIVGIISYETMMLLAIVVTFAVMVRKIIRAHPASLDYDPRVDDGYIGVAISMDEADPRHQSIHTWLNEAGAREVRTQ
jgi:hypothetical protein